MDPNHSKAEWLMPCTTIAKCYAATGTRLFDAVIMRSCGSVLVVICGSAKSERPGREPRTLHAAAEPFLRHRRRGRAARDRRRAWTQSGTRRPAARCGAHTFATARTRDAGRSGTAFDVGWTGTQAAADVTTAATVPIGIDARARYAGTCAPFAHSKLPVLIDRSRRRACSEHGGGGGVLFQAVGERNARKEEQEQTRGDSVGDKHRLEWSSAASSSKASEKQRKYEFKN